jgi:hypothetical protein
MVSNLRPERTHTFDHDDPHRRDLERLGKHVTGLPVIPLVPSRSTLGQWDRDVCLEPLPVEQ